MSVNAEESSGWGPALVFVMIVVEDGCFKLIGGWVMVMPVVVVLLL